MLPMDLSQLKKKKKKKKKKILLNSLSLKKKISPPSLVFLLWTDIVNGASPVIILLRAIVFTLILMPLSSICF